MAETRAQNEGSYHGAPDFGQQVSTFVGLSFYASVVLTMVTAGLAPFVIDVVIVQLGVGSGSAWIASFGSVFAAGVAFTIVGGICAYPVAFPPQDWSVPLERKVKAGCVCASFPAVGFAVTYFVHFWL